MASIGVFDSGFGGLTILKSLQVALPQHNFIYLCDNARAPYGEKSFETVNLYTTQAVDWLFAQDCPLIILACNTASALALRNIQHKHLPAIHAGHKRVLGVVRPTTETIGQYSQSHIIGLLGTPATVGSGSYKIEIEKFFPEVELYQEACPLWVPMIEHGEYRKESSKAVVKENLEKLISQNPKMDTILLACTHYPILQDIIEEYVPSNIKVITQGDIVAKSLKSYLQRHPILNQSISRNGETKFYTTEANTDLFIEKAKLFYGQIDSVKHQPSI